MSVCDNMENNLKAATTNVNLQNDLINCWKKNKSIYYKEFDMANVMAVDKRGDSISIVTELGVFDIEKGLYPRDYEDIYNSIKEGDEIDIDLETSEKTIVINGKIYKF